MVREEVFMALVDFDHKEAHEELKNRFQTGLFFQLHKSPRRRSAAPVEKSAGVAKCVKDHTRAFTLLMTKEVLNQAERV
nr:hypothetical protein [Tanacetum cinerariifolium]